MMLIVDVFCLVWHFRVATMFVFQVETELFSAGHQQAMTWLPRALGKVFPAQRLGAMKLHVVLLITYTVTLLSALKCGVWHVDDFWQYWSRYNQVV